MRDDASGPGLDAWSLLGIGGYNIACIFAGMGAGRLVDAWLETLPAFMLVGLGLGVAAGVLGTWFRIRPFLG